MHDAAVSLKKESLREAGLGMLGWDKTVGDGFAGPLRLDLILVFAVLGWFGILTRHGYP